MGVTERNHPSVIHHNEIEHRSLEFRHPKAFPKRRLIGPG